MRVLSIGLVALLACLPSAAWGEVTKDAYPIMQDTARRDTTARAARDTVRRRAPGDTTRAAADSAGNLAGSLPPGFENLDLRLNSRLEAKGEQVRNDRCGSSQLFATAFRCRGTFQPSFDFQFNLVTRGTVADRIHVDVDYDTQREFDASNNISIRYQGKESELLQRVEIGNVSFAPPTSRFITSGIPSGNYGVQALGRMGPMRFAAIAAQQKGNVVQDVEFVVGDRTVQRQTRDIEDYQIEPRRFFFTVDPLAFGASWPNVDILDRRQLSGLAAALPDSIRPSKVYVYRLLLGGQPRNPNGPQFRLIGDAASQRGQVYELLRERIDYYIDPSLLWFALVTPLSQNSERLVVAYTVRINGRDTTIATTGGTPDLEYVPGRDQLANLIWDPKLTPDDPAFRREIRSVYRVGGSDVRRQTVQVRIVTGGSADQEKPAAGGAETYLQQFRVAEATNSALFDNDNRLWPRPNDPNRIVAEGGGAEDVIRDFFLIFPSLQPFARNGLAGPIQNPANDTIYRTPGEYLYSSRHPQSFYRLRVSYEGQVSDEVGTLALNAIQLRQGSERLVIDGRQLVRGVDYDIDYELGRVTFTNPDELFPFARRVRVRYEENPLFTTIPTSIFGITTSFAGEHGALNFTAISQTQRTTFTRPGLGYEPASSLMAGVSGAFAFDASPLGNLVGRSLPFRDSIAGPSTIQLQGEFAMSRPRPNSKGQAYLEAFDGQGGISVSLLDNAWYYSSQPTLGTRLASRVGARALDLPRATTLAWQTSGTDRNGTDVRFTIEQIDPQTKLVGTSVSSPETLLWLTLYPLSIGGQRDPSTNAFRWTVGNTPPGQRWRSIRTSLGASGADLSGVETVEFWTLIDTSTVRQSSNPILVLDLGDVSENSVAFSPETLTVANQAGGGTRDSTYRGKKLQGYNRLDSERDPFSRAFNVAVNDAGLPGDVVDTLVVLAGGVVRADTGVRVCTRGDIRRRALGDARTDCTVANSRLDEEDLDADNALRTEERLLRYIVDLTDPKSYDRRGECGARVNDPNGARPLESTLCWVHVRLPLASATDTINQGPLMRRVQALRVTAISASGASDAAFVTTAIARLRLVGAPWLKRSSRPLTGVAGEREQLGNGYVVAGVVGTADSTSGLPYEPPPGIIDEADNLQAQFNPTATQINERSLRLQAGGLARYDRAEAFVRFPEGQKSFLTYKELRVWARGRGNGWGQSGELQFFIKLGRDANNFYLYRTPASSGSSQAAWQPEIRVAFQKFFALRAKLEGAYLRGSADSLSCTGADSALIARSGLPLGSAVNRFAACDGGYMVYTTDPAVAPPNLGSVQEMAVGILRVDSATGPTPLIPTDTMEVWVDDIRLTDIVHETGFAGQIGVALALGDLATVRIAATRRDPNFRQLAEAPSFATNNDVELSTTVRLDQFLPPRIGVALPLTVSHASATIDPTFLGQSDLSGDEIPGLRTPKTSATTYALSARRTQPLSGPWYAPIVNHLGVTGTYIALGNRS
ncbi:MAG TPA: cell surface protein SprA, partial [Gemmatimonadaceae bacterium]|nr:cell surface protein SprA [Gemmatimonadaceae bacterium]